MTAADVTFSSGGVQCAATLYRPDGVGDDYPCVVMGHGATLTRGDGVPSYAKRFAEAGLAAFAFDYRHWGGSEEQAQAIRKGRKASWLAVLLVSLWPPPPAA
jgi:uncharacterized protein